MPAGTLPLCMQADFVAQVSGALQHLGFAQPPEPAHRDHDVLLRGEILEQEMKLEDETEQLIAPPREDFIRQVRDALALERDRAAIRSIEQAEDVEHCALAT